MQVQRVLNILGEDRATIELSRMPHMLYISMPMNMYKRFELKKNAEEH